MLVETLARLPGVKGVTAGAYPVSNTTGGTFQVGANVTATDQIKLSIADMRRFEAHIGGCDGCTEYLTQFRRVIQLTGTLTPDDLTPEAESALLEVFRSWNTAATGAVAAAAMKPAAVARP